MKRIAVFGWPLAGVCVSLFDTVARLALGEPAPLHHVLWGLAAWSIWSLLAPVIVRIATAVPFRRRDWPRFLLVHTAGALAMAVAHFTLFALLRKLILGAVEPGRPFLSVVVLWLPVHLTLDLFTYAVTVLATHVVRYLQAAGRREEERIALERSLAQAELDLFKLQLPADVVSARLLEIERTIPRDAEEAERLIERFGAFLRQQLDAVRVPLETDAVAHDEDELEPGVPDALPLPVRLLLLFSFLPAMRMFMSALYAASAVARGIPLRWEPVAYSIWLSWVFFPVTLAMAWLGARVRRVTLLAAAAVILPTVWFFAVHTVQLGWNTARLSWLAAALTLDFLVYFAVGLGALAYERYRTLRENALQVAQLESRLVRMRVTMLRLQLNPHFLFNTLNSVAALLEDDAAGAAKMAAQLRRFVGHVLATSNGQETSLAEELDVLATYVAIENVRFAGRVQLDVSADDEARRALVPTFLLQPLVENTLRHGLLPNVGGRVSVGATAAGGMLRLSVRDDGRSGRAEEPAREGIGLSNTRARLAGMYGDDFVLDIAQRGDGFDVALAIPYRVTAS